ncbi:MAG: RagB/SusD domain protein [Mucilaginibacter sp.]|nr:RagB/SusD domain protein [Mucilaginibacter sp.]
MKTYIFPYKIISCVLIITLFLLLGSCRKFVDVGAPSDQLVTATAFATDNTLKATLAGMYITLAVSNSYDLQMNLSFATGNSADETLFFISTIDYDPFLNNNLAADHYLVSNFWSELYTSIYQANAIIAGVENSTGNLSTAMKTEAVGEAKFVRAFCYFYLVNLYGDVPIALTTDAATNNALFRSPKAKVYQQIIADLTDAKNSIVADYSYASSERTRPNKYAAIALLARTYLYMGDWANAQTNAALVINYTSLYSLLPTSGLGGIFLKNNKEAIWQVTGTAFPDFTQEGQNYYQGTSNIPNYQLSNNLLKAFEPGDLRYTNWVGVTTYSGVTYYYPYKYKQHAANTSATAEYCTYLRLAEQYLVRAEAMAEQNNLSGAIADINMIRNRAGLSNTTATSQADILLAIEQERKIELFSEYGHRWNDLRRTGRANAVLGAEKTGWTANAALYPIPKYDRDNNHNLTQNPGY